MRATSGSEREIVFERQRAVVVELGAGLRTYTVGGRHVIDGFGAGQAATAGRGQVLAPWPNRLDGGSYAFGGTHHQLPLTELVRGSAIHGLVRREPWLFREHEPHRLTLAHLLQPQPGYPFTLSLEVEYTLSTGGLTARMTATNAGREPCPYGAGAHPYLCPGAASVDDASLRLPARTLLETDERGIPVASGRVAATELDFRWSRLIGTTRLDHCFTDLERDVDGLARVELTSRDGTVTTLWVDLGFPYVMVYTGDASPDVVRRSLAVEPMTCPPNAFRSGEALVVLEPGVSHTATWGLTSG